MDEAGQAQEAETGAESRQGSGSVDGEADAGTGKMGAQVDEAQQTDGMVQESPASRGGVEPNAAYDRFRPSTERPVVSDGGPSQAAVRDSAKAPHPTSGHQVKSAGKAGTVPVQAPPAPPSPPSQPGAAKERVQEDDRQ